MLTGISTSEAKTLIKSEKMIPKYVENIIVQYKNSYYDGNIDLRYHPVMKCPLHDENTASWRWYEDTDTFYCFGCSAGGDVITLHRKFEFEITGRTPTYGEAIEYLYKVFIEKSIDADESAEKFKSTVKELGHTIDIAKSIELSKQVIQANNRIQWDVEDTEIKKELWYMMDIITRMVRVEGMELDDAIRDISKLGKLQIKELLGSG